MYIFLWLVYVAMPILDYILPVDHSNLSPERVRLFERDIRFLVPLYVYYVFESIVYVVVLYNISIGVIGTTSLSFFMYAYSYAQPGTL